MLSSLCVSLLSQWEHQRRQESRFTANQDVFHLRPTFTAVPPVVGLLLKQTDLLSVINRQHISYYNSKHILKWSDSEGHLTNRYLVGNMKLRTFGEKSCFHVFLQCLTKSLYDFSTEY